VERRNDFGEEKWRKKASNPGEGSKARMKTGSLLINARNLERRWLVATGTRNATTGFYPWFGVTSFLTRSREKG